MSYDLKTVRFDGKQLVLVGARRVNCQQQQVEMRLRVGDKIECIVSGWGEDPLGQFYICQGMISKIERDLDLTDYIHIYVRHDSIESEIQVVDIQKKLNNGAELAPRRLTAWY